MDNIPLPADIADFLLGKIKKIGRKIFLNILSGAASFISILFLTEVFGRNIQFLFAFISGMIFWLPVIGSFFERRNLFADLENGSMYYLENMKKVTGGYLHSNEIYQPLTYTDRELLNGYVLLYSRLIVKNL